MAQLAAPAFIASTAISALSDVYRGGEAARAGAEDAAQLLQRARLRSAEANARFREELRLGRLKRSRAIAVAAKSGGGVDDTTVQNVIADIGADSRYRAMTALYEGSEEAIGLTSAAKKRIREGRAAGYSGLFGAASTALSGYSTWAEKYG